jgi:Tfp pilus assembly protein PilN
MAEAITLKKLTSFTSGSIPRLMQLGSFLQRVLTFSPADDMIFPQKGLSVSIGRGNISVAYGTRFLSGTTVNGAKTYPLEGDSRYPQPEEMVSSLALAVNEFGAPRTGITLSIPKAWTIIRTVEFPSTVKENLASVIAYEMDRITPFTSDEALFDFRVLKEDSGKIVLLVMAARADAVMPYMASLSENGFTVSRITFDLAGIGALCGQEGKDSDILFIGIDEKEYEGAQFTGGSLVQVFSGSFTATDDSSRAETISASLKKLIEASKDRGNSPKIIAHVKGNSPSFVELLKVRMSVPFSLLRLTDARIKFAQTPKEVPYGAVGSLAESLQGHDRGLNLLKRGVYAKQKPPVASTIILTAAIIVIWVIYLLAPLRVERERLTEITHAAASKKAEVKKVEDLKKAANDLAAEIASIRGFKEDRPMVLNIMKELTAVIPKTTWLTRVRVTETGVDIEGYAASASELLPKLEASKLFQKVEFASPTFRDVKMNSDRFVIKMEIEGIKKSDEPAKKTDSGAKKGAGEKPRNEKK